MYVVYVIHKEKLKIVQNFTQMEKIFDWQFVRSYFHHNVRGKGESR